MGEVKRGLFDGFTHADVGAMSVEDLRAEVRMWRESAAIRLRRHVETIEEAAFLGELTLLVDARRLLRTEFDTLLVVHAFAPLFTRAEFERNWRAAERMLDVAELVDPGRSAA